MTPRRTLTAGITAAVIGGLLTAAPPPAIGAPQQDPEQRVIVTLRGAPAAAGKGRLVAADAGEVGADRTALAVRQQAFLDEAQHAGLHAGKPRKLNLLLNAVALTVRKSEVAALRQLPGVASVREDAKVKVFTDTSVPLIGAPEVWKRKDPSGRGADGTGVTVAVLDSGVDYSHPDLGGGFGAGHKVVAGYDFVNNDGDPMDDHSHGSHVAGIIAGRAAAKGGITGVAPGATLTAYKVMDANGEGYTSDIVAGIEAAADPANPHRADVINMSLGGTGDGSDPMGQAATAATRAGVVVVAAAGNEGPGRATVGTPAAADGVLAVGASVSGVRIPGATYKDGEKVQTYRGLLSAGPQDRPVTAPLVDVGAGSPEEWEKAGDVRGKVVRINMMVAEQLNHLSSQEIELAREAEKRGAIALIGGRPSGGGPVLAGGKQDGTVPLPANSAGVRESGDSLRMDSLVVMGIDDTQYAELSGRLANGKVEVTVTGTDVTDRIASFSSRGPDLSFDLKPEIVAPGYEIRSTVPKALYGPGQYRMSGTSMAAPHVAGAAALIRQLHPGQAPGTVTSELVNSAKKLDGAGPTTHGSGRLDIAAAANAADGGLTASPATLSYGLADLAHRTVGGSKRLTVNNTGAEPRTVRLEVSGRAKLSRSRLTVPARGSAQVTVTVAADRPREETEISGEVTLSPAGGPALHVPYLLAVRKLFVQAGPDPSDGHSGVVVYAPTALAAAPEVRVTSPRGKTWTVRTTHVTGAVYRADLTVRDPGAYLVAATAGTADGKRLDGNTDGFEVTPQDSRRNRWEPIGPHSESGDVTVAPSKGDLGVLSQGDKAGPWLTSDNGRNWTQLSRLPVTDKADWGDVVIDAANPDRWWYSVNSASGFPRTGSVLRTDDRGRTWKTLDTPDTYIAQLMADERTRVLVARTATGLLVSTDGGDHWREETTGVPGKVHDAELAGGKLYYATGDALWARTVSDLGDLGEAQKIYEPKGDQTLVNVAADSEVIATYEVGTGVVGSHDDGKTWTTLVNPGHGGNGLTANGGKLYIGSRAGTRIGSDHGRRWTTVPAPNTASTTPDFDRWGDGSLTVSADAAGLYRTTDDGKSYRRTGVQGSTVNDLVVSGSTLLAAGSFGTHRTALPVAGPDWGNSGGEGMIGVTTAKLVASPQDPKILWRVRFDAFGGFTVQRSGDSGKTWEKKGRSAGRVTSLAVHPADPDRVYVGYSNLLSKGLFTTNDGGAHWKNLRHDSAFTTVSGDPSNPRGLLLGNADGLFRSDDGGINVTKVASGRVDTIERDGTKLFVGGDTIRYSTDGGRSFRTGDTGKLPVRISDIQRVAHALYAASTSVWDKALPRGGRGVLRSTDGGRSWHNISTGLQNLNATTLATDGRSLYVGTVLGGVHRLKL